MNIANGCLGSMAMSCEETARVRLAEAIEAASLIPATHYPPICDDMNVSYTAENFAKFAAVVRQANPSIVLTHSPTDYMEDHEVACRLAVSATFAKGMPNFVSSPPKSPSPGDVAVYHASPHGNCTPLQEKIEPHIYVDTSDLLEKKQALLACHRSQQSWLDSTQKMSSYLQTMVDMDKHRGGLSGRFDYAESFRQRLHFGFSGAGFDPLCEALGKHAFRVST
jgi:LmbE family N-acetylglucosaminyl deacetylase